MSDHDAIRPVYDDEDNSTDSETHNMTEDELANESYLDSLPEPSFWYVRVVVTEQGGTVVYDSTKDTDGPLLMYTTMAQAMRDMASRDSSVWAWVGDGYHVAYTVSGLHVAPF